jgi:hypothetical protein
MASGCECDSIDRRVYKCFLICGALRSATFNYQSIGQQHALAVKRRISARVARSMYASRVGHFRRTQTCVSLIDCVITGKWQVNRHTVI